MIYIIATLTAEDCKKQHYPHRSRLDKNFHRKIIKLNKSAPQARHCCSRDYFL